MNRDESYNRESTLRDRINFVLGTMEKGSAGEVAAEIMEMEGVSSEDGVADLTTEVEAEMEKMLHEGLLDEIREHRQKKRYARH